MGKARQSLTSEFDRAHYAHEINDSSTVNTGMMDDNYKAEIKQW